MVWKKKANEDAAAVSCDVMSNSAEKRKYKIRYNSDLNWIDFKSLNNIIFASANYVLELRTKKKNKTQILIVDLNILEILYEHIN